jgi:hypothetical protein
VTPIGYEGTDAAVNEKPVDRLLIPTSLKALTLKKYTVFVVRPVTL